MYVSIKYYIVVLKKYKILIYPFILFINQIFIYICDVFYKYNNKHNKCRYKFYLIRKKIMNMSKENFILFQKQCNILYLH